MRPRPEPSTTGVDHAGYDRDHRLRRRVLGGRGRPMGSRASPAGSLGWNRSGVGEPVVVERRPRPAATRVCTTSAAAPTCRAKRSPPAAARGCRVGGKRGPLIAGAAVAVALAPRGVLPGLAQDGPGEGREHGSGEARPNSRPWNPSWRPWSRRKTDAPKNRETIRKVDQADPADGRPAGVHPAAAERSDPVLRRRCDAHAEHPGVRPRDGSVDRGEPLSVTG